MTESDALRCRALMDEAIDNTSRQVVYGLAADDADEEEVKRRGASIVELQLK